jgi:hypothetical protein
VLTRWRVGMWHRVMYACVAAAMMLLLSLANFAGDSNGARLGLVWLCKESRELGLGAVQPSSELMLPQESHPLDTTTPLSTRLTTPPYAFDWALEAGKRLEQSTAALSSHLARSLSHPAPWFVLREAPEAPEAAAAAESALSVVDRILDWSHQLRGVESRRRLEAGPLKYSSATTAVTNSFISVRAGARSWTAQVCTPNSSAPTRVHEEQESNK